MAPSWRAPAKEAHRSMPKPLHLNDEEIDVLMGLAAPIAYGRRDEFLQAVASTLAGSPQVGPGEIYRAAREVQRHFTLGAQREAEIASAPRHLTPCQAAR
jgi:hypothetical protein